MKPDRDIVARIEALPSATIARMIRDHSRDITAELAEYQRACELASGPIAERSNHWRLRAGVLKARLRHLLTLVPAHHQPPRSAAS